jgi:transposase
MSKRRKWSEEFKQQAVDLASQTDVSKRQIAEELGINANMLGRWCRERRAHGQKAFMGQGKARDEELASLKRELAQVKKERDFLKEAAAFFAKASK